MPAADDHPMRLRRIRAGITQTDLAKRAGVTRAVVSQIEEARVKRPNLKVVQALAVHMNTTPETIFEEVEQWRTLPAQQQLSERAIQALQLPPSWVSKYDSFLSWRRDIAPNPTAFASLLKLPRRTIVRYEEGEVAMPKPLMQGLSGVLGLSSAYIEELRKLDVRK